MRYKKIVRAILANKKISLLEQINLVKVNVSPGEYKEALQSHPLLKRQLNNHPYFQNISDIRIKEPYQFTTDFKKELKWALLNIEQNLKDLNDFISLKEAFEKAWILDDHLTAKKILSKVEEQFGVSLWSIEANFIVEENIEGSQGNWNKLSNYLKEIDNSIYEFIINSSSKRIEKKLAYESYLTQFQNDIDNINAVGFLEDFFVFKNFVFPNFDYNYKKLESVVYVSHVFSVIDQYLIILDVVLENISTSAELDSQLSSFLKKIEKEVKSDFRISNMLNVIDGGNNLRVQPENVYMLPCLDLFYSGKFSEALEISLSRLGENPTEYEYYLIYVKSLINLDYEFEPTGISKHVDEILLNTFSLLKFSEDHNESYKNLLRTALYFMNTNFGKQIFALINEIEGISERHYFKGVLSSSFNSYKNLLFRKSRASVLNTFYNLRSHHSFRIYEYKQGLKTEWIEIPTDSEEQRIISIAQREYSLGNYENVISVLKKAENLDSNFYYLEHKISLIYTSYLKMNLLTEALYIFGKYYFNELIHVRKLNNQDLFKELQDSVYKHPFISLIEYPLIFSLNVKEYDLFEAYDEFMIANEYDFIRELDVPSFINKFSPEKAIFFFLHVATIDTLKYSSDYSSIDEVEEDRIWILNKLLEIDSEEKLLYEQEINEIYRVNSVRKVLKEVDEGRLFIDVSNLRKIQSKKFKDDFDRLKEIQHSSSSQGLIGFNPANTKNWESTLTEKRTTNEKYNRADYLAFKSIYLESRDNFLFSKEYGLDSSLSTRIRHGALKNHIRSVFEKLNLVTSKLDNLYKENDIWKNQLKEFPEINPEVQEILRNFSRQIDDYTVFIVEELVQIQTEKSRGKEEGIFEYFTNDATLHGFYLQNKHLFDSAETVVDFILTSLVNHTLLNLQRGIVELFHTKITMKFHSFIDEAVSTLRELNLPSHFQLIPNFIKSRTEIEKELDLISDWFYLNTSSSTSLLSIETVINASIELTNNINPNHPIRPKINFECGIFGVYSNLVFVFNILFNNIIQHSKLPSDAADIRIDISAIEEEYYRLSFSNALNPNASYEEDIRKLQRVKENWNDHSSIERSNKEGESGFDKIKRILLYESFSKTDKFGFRVENNRMFIELFFPYTKINR